MPRQERARQLLDVAESLFAERGTTAVTMDEIAEVAGVTKPVLYDHFGSKSGLLAACISRARLDLQRSTEAAVSQAESPAEALYRGLGAFFAFVRDHAPAWSVLVAESQLDAQAAAEVERVRTDQAAYLAGLLAAELPDCPPVLAAAYAEIVIGASERLAAWWQRHPELALEDVVGAQMDLTWLGLAARHEGVVWPRHHQAAVRRSGGAGRP